MNNGRFFARLGFALGIGTSIAANIGHTFVGRQPPLGAVLFSCFWPIALYISIEVIARVDWPVGRKWWWMRYGGLTSVAAIAAILSYKHMAGLLTAYGEDPISAAIGPVAIDGLMIVCTAALLAIADNAKRPKPLPAIGRVEMP